MTKRLALITVGSFLGLAACLVAGCSTMSSVFATQPTDTQNEPIRNPFVDNTTDPALGHAMVVRSKEGDKTVEVELPASQQNVTDLVVPIQDALGGRSPASLYDGGSGDVDGSNYKDVKPTAADREITSEFPHQSPEDELERRNVEQGLGLIPSQDSTPAGDTSYLAAVDHVKQLFRIGRYEAALIEVEDLLRQYPTAPQLYSMRGTLLDRVGQPELAIQSWAQALRFDPKNESLRRYIERKRKIASVPAQ